MNTIIVIINDDVEVNYFFKNDIDNRKKNQTIPKKRKKNLKNKLANKIPRNDTNKRINNSPSRRLTSRHVPPPTPCYWMCLPSSLQFSALRHFSSRRCWTSRWGCAGSGSRSSGVCKGGVESDAWRAKKGVTRLMRCVTFRLICDGGVRCVLSSWYIDPPRREMCTPYLVS